MSAYRRTFSKYYDALTSNIDYAARAAYFHSLFQQKGILGNHVLDLACGTGTLSLALISNGYEVIGIDGSSPMVDQARAKSGGKVPFFHQKMEQFTVERPVDGVVCALDSLNHVLTTGAVAAIFRRVFFALRPGGIFLFDVNTPYKQERILGDHTFVYDLPKIYCVWQNQWRDKPRVTLIDLDLFEKGEDGSYRRESEHFAERAFTHLEWMACLKQAGFSFLCRLGDDSWESPKEKAERWIYAAKRP